jgi:predicted ATP-grasp superfamily ATP-dependent carboligase
VRILIVGISTRAAAESAARAGFAVTAIDAFGDLDQHPSVRALSLPRDFGAPVSARALAQAARTSACDAVAYLSSFENHPDAVSTLAEGRALWGNAPAVLRRVRDPGLLARTLGVRGCSAATVRDDAPPKPPSDIVEGGPEFLGGPTDWLVKPLSSGGGHGIRRWRRGTRLPRRHYRQELVEGTPGSVVFVAAGGRAVPLGVSRQLVGERAFGAAGYRYCGSILAAPGDAQFARGERLVDAAHTLAGAVAEEFGVVGVNGVDFVARDGVPCAIEVNPRWSSSMELVERVHGLSVFGIHAAACVDGTLPELDLVRLRRGAGAAGKAIVFARRDVIVGDTRAWRPGDDAGRTAVIRDIPRPGDCIHTGRPICTVFASGRDARACHAALVQRAGRVYEELAEWERT